MLANRTNPIIFPLRETIFQRVFLQQRPRNTCGLKVVMPPILPWDDMNRPPNINFGKVGKPPNVSQILPTNYGLCVLNTISIQLKLLKQSKNTSLLIAQKNIPNVIHSLKPMPREYWMISGTTKDKDGNALANCAVHLLRTADDFLMEQKTSDENGFFEFRSASNPSNTHYIVAYKAGSPDVTGVTVNTLVPT